MRHAKTLLLGFCNVEQCVGSRMIVEGSFLDRAPSMLILQVPLIEVREKSSPVLCPKASLQRNDDGVLLKLARADAGRYPNLITQLPTIFWHLLSRVQPVLRVQ